MIRITRGHEISQHNDTEWRRAKSNIQNFDTDIMPSTSQSDVDAIAAAMDAPQLEEPTQDPALAQDPAPTQAPQGPLADPRQQDIHNMVKNYIQQNGGIPTQANEQVTKKKVILG